MGCDGSSPSRSGHSAQAEEAQHGNDDDDGADNVDDAVHGMGRPSGWLCSNFNVAAAVKLPREALFLALGLPPPQVGRFMELETGAVGG